ncbi:hypothetical protein JYG23_14410 [Sedimentibacter sp. zth1]|uniref:hypothetical protein n=1 Tax=Sedimentibacter sp. zth1 TaxID=2816908 RepID=UPI001A913DFD|nr:hypothetical protein [Sedimentibacter sp. zth1]QSX05837.1 hypothetical protein JYG23_14410 [Sedimentibacter sp. zth1]
MNKSTNLKSMVLAALLCAIGIVIPIISPIRIVLEPMSFTLASHVALFISMFISPFVSITVALGTTLGFFMAGFPIVIVLRALSHIVFAVIGSCIIKKIPDVLSTKKKSILFGFIIAIIHAVCEVIVVIPFYFGNSLPTGYYAKGFLYTVVLLVGVGTIVHSLIDYYISIIIWYPLNKAKVIKVN